MTRETSTNATLNFHMKHIDSKVCRKILDQTGWYSFTEYELENRVNDFFECRITDGFLDNERPDVDESRYLVTEISLHHLTKTFRKYLLEVYLQNYSLIEYETLFADTNSIYVVVEYYNEYDNEYDREDDRECDREDDKEFTQTNTLHNYFDYASDNEKINNTVNDNFTVYGKKYDDPQSVWSSVDHISKDTPKSPIGMSKLSTFKYKLKSKNGKTLILFRPNRKFVNFEKDSHWVKYDDTFVYPTEWNIKEDGSVVGTFSKKHNGWLVARSDRYKLKQLGATLHVD